MAGLVPAFISGRTLRNDRQAQGCDLLGTTPLEISLGHFLLHTALGLGQRVQCSRVVQGKDASALDHPDAAYVDIANRAVGGGVEQRAERVPARHHEGMLEIDQHDIGLGTRCKPTEIRAAQRLGASDRRGVEEIGRGHGADVFRGDAREKGRPALTARITQDGGWFGGAERAPNLPRDPAVLSEGDLATYVFAFGRTGFAGADAWYLNAEVNMAYAARLPDGGSLQVNAAIESWLTATPFDRLRVTKEG